MKSISIVPNEIKLAGVDEHGLQRLRSSKRLNPLNCRFVILMTQDSYGWHNPDTRRALSGWYRKPEVKPVLLDVVTDHDVTVDSGHKESLFARYCRDCTRQNDTQKKHRPQTALRAIVQLNEFRRLLIFRPFDAPGLTILGAEYEFMARNRTLRHSATGCGRCFCSALMRLYGESLEYETRYRLIRPASDGQDNDQSPPNLSHSNSAAGSNRELPESFNGDDEISQIPALRLNDGKTVTLPAKTCFLTENGNPVHGPPLSAGLGAGASPALARQHAIAEIVEHDAVALWWYGARQPQRIRFDAYAAHAHAQLRQDLRQGQRNRTELLLDIGTDLNVPCVASISFDRSGQIFACGSAARPSYAQAIAAAYREMCQMEYAHHLVREKLNHVGLGELNAVDQGHVQRAALIRPSNFLLQPVKEKLIKNSVLVLNNDNNNFIQNRLLQSDLQLMIADLSTKNAPACVVKAIAPQLQPLNRDVVTTRLGQSIEQTGGGLQYNHGVDP